MSIDKNSFFLVFASDTIGDDCSFGETYFFGDTCPKSSFSGVSQREIEVNSCCWEEDLGSFITDWKMLALYCLS